MLIMHLTALSQMNKCTSLRRKAIVTYFETKSEDENQTQRKFLSTYSPFLYSSNLHKSNDIMLRERDQMVTDNQSIANIFYDYFVNLVTHDNDVPDPCDYGGDCQ